MSVQCVSGLGAEMTAAQPCPRTMWSDCSRWTALLAVLLLLLLDVEMKDTENCLGEVFTAHCSADEVILVDAARFGRMEMGRCVAHNFGFLGCSADVRDRVDARCSGRHACRFPVADQDVGILNSSPCPKDVSSYLQVAYSCLKVATCDQTQCRRFKQLKLSSQEGLLASLTTLDYGCGSNHCPWLIQVLPGQRVNVTLLDFTRPAPANNTRGRGMFCREYAVISEPETSRSVNICGGEYKKQKPFISKTHRVLVRMLGGQSPNDINYFVLKYEASGCPNLPSPADTWVERSDAKLTVRCNYTRESWTLVCSGTTWIGQIGNCSQSKPWGKEKSHSAIGLPSLEVSVLIIVGVALVVVIYIAVTIVCVLYFRRHKRGEDCDDDKGMDGCTVVEPGLEHDCNARAHPDIYEEHAPMLLTAGKLGRRPDGDYADICEMQLLQGGMVDPQNLPHSLKCHSVHTLHTSDGATHVHHPDCPASVPTFRTFKPGSKDPLYEPTLTLGRKFSKKKSTAAAVQQQKQQQQQQQQQQQRTCTGSCEQQTCQENPYEIHQPNCPNHRPAMRITGFPSHGTSGKPDSQDVASDTV